MQLEVLSPQHKAQFVSQANKNSINGGQWMHINADCALPIFTTPQMLTPFHTLPTRFFYPIGNTPAVCLTRHMPPEQPVVDCLLLGCGDPRNILYTLFCDQNGALENLRDTNPWM